MSTSGNFNQTNLGGSRNKPLGFKLAIQEDNPRIISAGSVGSSDEQVLDALKTTVTNTGATFASQYKVSLVREKGIGSTTHDVVYSTSNPSISTIEQTGITTHVSDGLFTITATSASSNIIGERISELSVENTTTVGGNSSTISYEPDPIVVSDHILVLFNSNVANSTTCKNYYLANRPRFGTYDGGVAPNVLDCPCTTFGTSGFESITYANFETEIETPLINWIAANPSKPIRYIILMYGMPSRVSGFNSDNTRWSPSVQFAINESLQVSGIRSGESYEHQTEKFSVGQFQGDTALITSLNMDTLADAQAYVDKLKTVYDAMPEKNVIISGDAAGVGGTTYYIDDIRNASFTSNPYAYKQIAAILEENPSANITYAGLIADPVEGSQPTPDQTAHITSASNVRGYVSWGYNGGLGNSYANDGTITFSGNSGWYYMFTLESFNGQRSTFQGNIMDWFKSNAFGGTSHANTPAFATSHTEEPSLGGTENRNTLKFWETEDTDSPYYLAIETAWSNRPNAIQCVGDPLITR